MRDDETGSDKTWRKKTNFETSIKVFGACWFFLAIDKERRSEDTLSKSR